MIKKYKGVQGKVKFFFSYLHPTPKELYQRQQFPVYPSEKIQCRCKHMAWHISKP